MLSAGGAGPGARDPQGARGWPLPLPVPRGSVDPGAPPIAQRQVPSQTSAVTAREDLGPHSAPHGLPLPHKGCFSKTPGDHDFFF